jgi:hypothetical protein
LFGPWSPGLDPTERRAQLRSLAALAAVFTGSGSELVAALRDAEHGEAAAAHAFEVLNRLPALTKRRLLSAFGAVTWPRQPSRRGSCAPPNPVKSQ